MWRGHTLGSVSSDRGSYAGTDRGRNNSKPASLCQTVMSQGPGSNNQSSMEPAPNPGWLLLSCLPSTSWAFSSAQSLPSSILEQAASFPVALSSRPTTTPPVSVLSPSSSTYSHLDLGRAQDLELNVHGAPNFRAPRYGNLNVFGVAQPRTQGLRAILSILRCRPNTPSPSHVVWFSTREEPIGKSLHSPCHDYIYLCPYTVYISGRPFVLRDAAEPRRTLSISDRAENLEAIEARLKTDILQEASRCVSTVVFALYLYPKFRFGGVVLTHNEVGACPKITYTSLLIRHPSYRNKWPRGHPSNLDQRR